MRKSLHFEQRLRLPGGGVLFIERSIKYDFKDADEKYVGKRFLIELKVKKFICAALTEQFRICFYDKKIYVENVEELLPISDFLDSLETIQGEKAFIENKDVPAFCQEFLPVIQQFFKCKMVQFNPEDYGMIKPASLVYNWNSEIQKFAPQLTAKMVTGTAAERRKILEESEADDILLTSYDLLKRDINEYEKYSFQCEIIDEAQFIKNANTQAAKAVKEIQTGFRLALTGTPVENRLSELWSIFDYLMPGFLYSYKKFREEVEIPVVQNSDEDAMKRLQKMILPFVLRRLKKEVLTDLPDKLEENMFAQLTGEQQKLYDAHVKRMMLMLDKQSEEEFKSSKITILAELTRLRQICCDPSLVFEDYKGDSAKTEMCLNMIRNAVEGGHKILLFSQFTTMLDHLAKRLEEEKISYYMLTGSVSKEKRAQMVESFNKDDTQVFCISLKAGGTGLNLTAADIVIHFDPWWNLAVQNQATDRAHRIGQKNVVNVYKLIVKDTIGENIMKLQEKKRELADQILEGENLNGSSLTREELVELLTGK